MNEAGKNSYADCDHRTGNVGSAIALGLKNKGHAVTLGARDPEATKVTALGLETGAGVALPAEATATADVVILALPWATADGAMNPLGMIGSTLGLTVGHDTSGGEIVQGWLPDALVVKTLNQVGAEIMANTAALPHRPVMFMAGNDVAAKAVVAQVLPDLGFEALDAGDISKARLLEPFGMVWINQAIFRGKGRNWAFAAIEAST